MEQTTLNSGTQPGFLSKAGHAMSTIFDSGGSNDVCPLLLITTMHQIAFLKFPAL